MGVTVTESGATPRALLREMDRATKNALELAIDTWHEDMMPDHFEDGADEKYSYQPRTQKYINHKMKRFGQDRSLVYTGQSMRAAKSGIRISSRANRSANKVQAMGAMDVPKHFYKYRKNQPDKANELTRTTYDEDAKLERQFGRDVEDLLSDRMTGTTTKKLT